MGLTLLTNNQLRLVFLRPNTMSLDFYLVDEEGKELFQANITHNLGKMADAAGIYQALWRPEEIPATKAGELVPVLSTGLIELITHKDKYTAYDSPNGWGVYRHFVPFVESVLSACAEFPEATIKVWR